MAHVNPGCHCEEPTRTTRQSRGARKVFLLALLLPGLCAAATENFPTKPIRIVTSEVGGSLDFVARLVNVPYDPVKDFAAITLATNAPLLLVVHPGVPVKSVQELIALAKAHPGKLNYSSSSLGTPQHIAAELSMGERRA